MISQKPAIASFCRICRNSAPMVFKIAEIFSTEFKPIAHRDRPFQKQNSDRDEDGDGGAIALGEMSDRGVE
jgi:hypothetical protein